MHPDDERLANLVRLIRRRNGLTQVRLASRAGVPLNDLKRIESGRAGDVKLSRVRRVLDAEGGRARLVPWWNGAAADRLLDERHAQLVERVVATLRALAWRVEVEVSFSEYGERGSIDVFAWHHAERALAVCEVKSAIGSLEETNRALDVKARLAPTVAFDRFGWRPAVIARLLILPRSNTVRRTIDAHASTMATLYPGRGREVRAWLRQPSTPLRAIWFVSDGPDTSIVSRQHG